MPAERCPAFFITGTDTGVGKTFVTAALARYLHHLGLKIGVMKPIETGVTNLEQPGNDAQLLAWAAGSEDPADLIAPYRFSLPAAPAQAVESVGAHIDIDHIRFALEKVAQGKDLVLVEGAGGLMVPVQGGYLMADLAKHLGLPLLLVTHPSLGTINHTLLTTFAAQSLGLSMVGFIINKMPANPDAVESEAAHYLASLASADLLGVLPYIHDSEPTQCIELLSEAFSKMQTLPWLKSALGLN